MGSNVTDGVNSSLKQRLEEAGKDAGRREFNRLVNEAVETKTREDRLKQLKAKVEEAARQAARETYGRLKAEEESCAEGNVEEEDTLDVRQKSDVEAAGAACSERTCKEQRRR